jgi:hypothetical protein
MNTKSVKLPNYFQPKINNNLIRIGSANDGGYLVNKDDVYNSDLLLSFGICDDWSFEENFLQYKNINCFAFDGSLSNKFWLKQLFNSLLKLKFKKIFKYYKFKNFFKGKKTFIKKYVSDLKHIDHINFNCIIEKYCKNYNKIFLKVDIEGSEYRILNEVLENSDKISSFVVEFHDVDLNFEKIKNFIDNFPLKIIHTHANNYSNLNSQSNPTAIEITFSNFYIEELRNNLPDKLDSPNNKKELEFKIDF